MTEIEEKKIIDVSYTWPIYEILSRNNYFIIKFFFFCITVLIFITVIALFILLLFSCAALNVG